MPSSESRLRLRAERKKTEGRCRIFSARSVQTTFYSRPLIRFLRTEPFCGSRVVFTKWSFYIAMLDKVDGDGGVFTNYQYKFSSMLPGL